MGWNVLKAGHKINAPRARGCAAAATGLWWPGTWDRPMSTTTAPNPALRAAALPVLFGLSTAHLLNDMIQSLLPAIYPILKDNYGLDFGQIGLLTLAFQITASLLQPLVGAVSDRRPLPYSLAVGLGRRRRAPRTV